MSSQTRVRPSKSEPSCPPALRGRGERVSSIFSFVYLLMAIAVLSCVFGTRPLEPELQVLGVTVDFTPGEFRAVRPTATTALTEPSPYWPIPCAGVTWASFPWPTPSPTTFLNVTRSAPLGRISSPPISMSPALLWPIPHAGITWTSFPWPAPTPSCNDLIDFF